MLVPLSPAHFDGLVNGVSCVPSHGAYSVVGLMALHNRALPACPLPSVSLFLPVLSAGRNTRKEGWRRAILNCWAEIQQSQWGILDPKLPIGEVPRLPRVDHWLGAAYRKPASVEMQKDLRASQLSPWSVTVPIAGDVWDILMATTETPKIRVTQPALSPSLHLE